VQRRFDKTNVKNDKSIHSGSAPVCIDSANPLFVSNWLVLHLKMRMEF